MAVNRLFLVLFSWCTLVPDNSVRDKSNDAINCMPTDSASVEVSPKFHESCLNNYPFTSYQQLLHAQVAYAGKCPPPSLAPTTHLLPHEQIQLPLSQFPLLHHKRMHCYKIRGNCTEDENIIHCSDVWEAQQLEHQVCTQSCDVATQHHCSILKYFCLVLLVSCWG